MMMDGGLMGMGSGSGKESGERGGRGNHISSISEVDVFENALHVTRPNPQAAKRALAFLDLIRFHFLGRVCRRTGHWAIRISGGEQGGGAKQHSAA